MYKYYIMEFEFNNDKSKVNKQIHGIDFNEAKELWEDFDYVEIPVKTSNESRFLAIGKILDKH